MCIAASIWLLEIPKKIKYLQSKIHYTIIGAILIFGFSSTILIITNDLSYNQFEALSYVIENHDEQSTILASPVYTWILYDVFDMDNVPKDYAMILFEPVKTRKITVVADSHFMLDQSRGMELVKAYNHTHSVQYFQGKANDFDTRIYPYTNMRVNHEGFSIDVRTGDWNMAKNQKNQP
jgi:hypothetical protein